MSAETARATAVQVTDETASGEITGGDKVRVVPVANDEKLVTT